MRTRPSSWPTGVVGEDWPDMLDAPDNVRSCSKSEDVGMLGGTTAAGDRQSSERYAARSAAKLALLSIRDFRLLALELVSPACKDCPELELE